MFFPKLLFNKVNIILQEFDNIFKGQFLILFDMLFKLRI